MSTNRDVIVIGAGGHARVVIDALRSIEASIAGALDIAYDGEREDILGSPVLGGLDVLAGAGRRPPRGGGGPAVDASSPPQALRWASKSRSIGVQDARIWMSAVGACPDRSPNRVDSVWVTVPAAALY